MKKYTLLLVVLLAFVSCEKSLSLDNLVNDDIISTDDLPKSISFTPIAKGSLTGFGTSEIPMHWEIFKYSAQWEHLLEKINKDNAAVNVTDSFTETDIDFNQYSVVSVFGTNYNRKYDVEIIEVIENDENITVNYQLNATNVEEVSQPYHIVKIPAIERFKPFVFKKLNNINPINDNFTNVESTLIVKSRRVHFPKIPDTNLIVTDENMWNDLMERINFEYPSTTPFTDTFSQTSFDFNTHSLVFVFNVHFTQLCFTEITKVVENENNDIVVFYETTHSAANALSRPFHILRIPAIQPGQRVIFEKNLNTNQHFYGHYRFLRYLRD